MTEREYNVMGRKGLNVYPHAVPDATERELAVAGYVEARLQWKVGGGQEWGVWMNVSYWDLMTRQQCDELQAAITRCWEWIGEQPAIIARHGSNE